MGVGFVLMAPLYGESKVERLVAEARLAAASDLLAKVLAIPEFNPVIVATNSPQVAQEFKATGVLTDLDRGDFHFGRRLLEIISRYQLRKVFYAGAGSAPLLPFQLLAEVASRLNREEALVVTNNLFSSDWVGFSPGRILEEIRLPDSDNDLAWRLCDEGGLRPYVAPLSTATVFDIDTPAELGILRLYPGLEGKLACFLGEADIDTSRVQQVLQVLRDENAFIFVAGRVPSYSWIRLEKEAPCRTRVLSEERGMRSSGRQGRGEVRSLLAYLVEALKPGGFFRHLAEMADAAIIDTRVLMAHWRIWPPAEERFSSDLFRAEPITHPLLREFTEAAREAPIPVLLGGHSLVCGGIMALVDIADARPPHRPEVFTLSSKRCPRNGGFSREGISPTAAKPPSKKCPSPPV